MDETISRGVVCGGRVRDQGESSFSRDQTVCPPVVDRYNLIYMSMVLAGTGFLLPYNSFVSAVDFYKGMFTGSSIMFDISLVYILTSLLAVLLNNILVDTFTLNSRIKFGYVVSILTLGCVVISNSFSSYMLRDHLYASTLTAVAAVSLGATVQQSSFYGYTSMLPTRYTQAVMAGESMAGVLTSVFRVVTKLAVRDPVTSTTWFFVLSTLILILCISLFTRVQRSEFVSFYICMASHNKTQAEKRGGRGEGHLSYTKYQHSSSTDPVQEDAENFQMPEFGGSCRNQNRLKEKAEDGLADVEVRGRRIGGNVFKCMRGLHGGLQVRLKVCGRIIPHMVGIALTYAVTLALFPGIESEIESCSIGDWLPVLLISAFNISDLVGKVLAGVYTSWSDTELVLWPLSRIVLVPVLLLCVAPRSHPLITGGLAPLLLTMVLGVSNGVFGSIPMILASRSLPEYQREYSGNLMTIAYSLGLTAGSLISYWLEYILGESEGPSCNRNVTESLSLETRTNLTGLLG